MVNSGDFVIAAAVVVEKLERRRAVGAKKDSRRPRMSEFVRRFERCGAPVRWCLSIGRVQNERDMTLVGEQDGRYEFVELY